MELWRSTPECTMWESKVSLNELIDDELPLLLRP
jgi:hypothetical protein